MDDYRFIFTQEGAPTAPVVPAAPGMPVSDSPNNPATSSGSDSAFSGAGKRIVNTAVSQTVLSPLNSATGGLASPAYNLGKTVIGGGSMAAIGSAGAAVAIAAVQFAVQKIEQRIQQMEAKASAANERDNVLMRSGAKNFATDYTGGLAGVKSVDRVYR